MFSATCMLKYTVVHTYICVVATVKAKYINCERLCIGMHCALYSICGKKKEKNIFLEFKYPGTSCDWDS
jgi:hypothetical protein